jgi:hypothetical protein
MFSKNAKKKTIRFVFGVILFLSVYFFGVGDIEQSSADPGGCMGFCVYPDETQWECTNVVVPHCFGCIFVTCPQ